MLIVSPLAGNVCADRGCMPANHIYAHAYARTIYICFIALLCINACLIMPLLFRVSFLHSCFSLSQPHADSHHACQQQHHRHPVSHGRILPHRVCPGATAKACHTAFFFLITLFFTIQMSVCNLLTDTYKRAGTCGLTMPVLLLYAMICRWASFLGDDAARIVNAVICRLVSPMPTIHHFCIVIPHFLNLSVAHWLFRLVFLVVSTCTSPLFSTACLLFVWVAEQSSPNVWVRINGPFS